MKCKLCGSINTEPLPFEWDIDRSPPGNWVRCWDCGSDSNDVKYNMGNYTVDLAVNHEANGGGPREQENSLRFNCDILDMFRDQVPDNTFLDVGCCDGAGLRVMQNRGWSVHGFDVFKPNYYGSHITVSPLFSADLFPRKYSAVMCREVFEHVLYPGALINELRRVCLVGGLFQLQTPAPTTRDVAHVYQEPHLFVASPTWLRERLEEQGEIIHEHFWEGGQLYTIRVQDNT